MWIIYKKLLYIFVFYLIMQKKKIIKIIFEMLFIYSITIKYKKKCLFRWKKEKERKGEGSEKEEDENGRFR